MEKYQSLNPCFSGICSQSRKIFIIVSLKFVLILVLVEYVLRVLKLQQRALNKCGLNPCFSGICSQSIL